MKKRRTMIVGVAIAFLMAAMLVVAAYAASGNELINRVLRIVVFVVSLPFAFLVMAIEWAEDKKAAARKRRRAASRAASSNTETAPSATKKPFVTFNASER